MKALLSRIGISLLICAFVVGPLNVGQAQTVDVPAPVASFVTIPSAVLRLEYNSAQMDPSLVATFKIIVNSGSQERKVYETGFADQLIFMKTGNWVNANSYSRTVTPPANVTKTQDQYGRTIFTIPANQQAEFTQVTKYNPKQLFAGRYYAKIANVYAPASTSGTDDYFSAPVNKSNEVTIVGEVSPYIDFVHVGNNAVSINGQRFARFENQVLIDGVVLYGKRPSLGNKGAAVSFNYVGAKLTPGRHSIAINHPVTGRSNTMWFEIPGTVPTNPTIPGCPTGAMYNSLTGAPCVPSTTGVITVSLDAGTPSITTHTVHSVYGAQGVEMQKFAARAVNADTKFISTGVSFTGEIPTAVYLYDGNTLIDSRSGAANVTFNFPTSNIVIAKDTTRVFTIKADFAPTTANGATSKSVVTSAQYLSDTIITIPTAGVTGNVQNFTSSTTGSQANLTFVSGTASTLTSISTGETSAVTGTIAFKVKPVGGSAAIPSTSDFELKLNSSAYSPITITNKTVTMTSATGAATGSILAEGSEYTIQVTGVIQPFAIPVTGISTGYFSLTSTKFTVGGTVVTQTSGLENFKTNSVTVVKSGPMPESSVTVFSPNGGESINGNTSFAIKFKPIPGVQHFVNLIDESNSPSNKEYDLRYSNGNAVMGETTEQQTFVAIVPPGYNITSGNKFKIEVCANFKCDKSNEYFTFTTSNVTPAPTTPTITGYSLINADTDQVIAGYETISNGVTLNLATLPTKNLNIRANVAGGTASVKFTTSGAQSSTYTESGAPFALKGDTNGNYLPWTPIAGTYTVIATPYSKISAQGTAGTAVALTFKVVTSTTTAADYSFSEQVANIVNALNNLFR
ncbi:MAG: hypothetical protein V4519_00645 [Patescibacteria group bacterium]